MEMTAKFPAARAIFLLIPVIAACQADTQTGDAVRLLADCSEPESAIATVQKADRVKVRYALGESSQTCYAVETKVNGTSVEGYLLGDAHPDVAAFERGVRKSLPVLPPAPMAANDEPRQPADPPASFAGLSGTSPDGRRVSLEQLSAPTIVLYFWAANDRKSVQKADEMVGVYELYRHKGVALVGVVSGASAAQVRRVVAEEEVVWPQIVDVGGALAARYPAVRDTPYFILDRRRNVVAALKSPDQVQREMAGLRKPAGGSE
ncbi:MAG TPA: TlpA disulfide reductase family protein [Bryobacteraceae bacterium]|nr:TlpA disulfide reductase family protein [Bryobacteraceae bacterium]